MWSLILPAVASVAGGALAGAGAREAGNKAADAADAATGLQRDIYQDQRGLSRPGYLTGGAATNMLAGMYGIGPQNYETAFDGGGYGSGGQQGQFSAYVASSPDLNAEWQQLVRNPKNPFKSIDEYGQYHWNNFGQSEGRQLPGMSGGGGSAPQRYGVGGDGQPIATGPAPSGGTGGNMLDNFWQSPFGQLATKGFLGVDTPEVQGAFATGGKALSGAQSIALQERGQNRAQGAFTNYLSGLQGLAGMAPTAAANVSSAGSSYGAQAGANMLEAGKARANSYGNMLAGIGQGVSGAIDTIVKYGQKN